MMLLFFVFHAEKGGIVNFLRGLLWQLTCYGQKIQYSLLQLYVFSIYYKNLKMLIRAYSFIINKINRSLYII